MKKLIYTFDSEIIPELKEVGGKAKSLIQTTKAGLLVPGGLALSVAFFDEWTKKIKASKEWKVLLKNPTKENCDIIKHQAQKLSLSDTMKKELDKNLKELKGEIFAVRSSSPEEDLEGISFAGMYETILGTTRNNLEESIASAYSSMLDFRVMEYKAQHNIDLAGTCISV
ncbi:MAG: PEP/pyruvate-binding domain-containing protein, partial [Candidatus Gracilibacteria bacterium]